jgi:SAM-dependent MidA family methyltransferase
MSIVLNRVKGVIMLNYLRLYINQQPLKMISYAEYMNIVLYHAQLGYYMKEGEKIGRSGDFITTSNLADRFGGTLARWFSNLVRNEWIAPQICEIGAGNGRFAKAFLQEWYASENPELTYYIVESSPYHLKMQNEKFDEKWQVKQVENLDEIMGFKGLIFSNELFDALPVHVIKKKQGQLFEIMITMEEDELIEKDIPLANDQIIRFLEEYQIHIVEGHRMEIALQMEAMFSRIEQVLSEGMIVSVDYGYSNEEWQEPLRSEGSLRGYYKHKQMNNVLVHPGEMDITSHIHWDVLKKLGERVGLHTVGKWRQDEFLLSIGILDHLESHHDPNPFSEVNRRNREIRSLIMPNGISASFQVLVQEKNSNGWFKPIIG